MDGRIGTGEQPIRGTIDTVGDIRHAMKRDVIVVEEFQGIPGQRPHILATGQILAREIIVRVAVSKVILHTAATRLVEEAFKLDRCVSNLQQNRTFSSILASKLTMIFPHKTR
jgi:hypothetical protein